MAELTEWDPDGAGPQTALLIASGSISMPGQPTANIAAWNGSAWVAMGPGLMGGMALNFAKPSDGALIVAGNFTGAGSVVGKVLRWDGTTWSAIGDGLAGADFITSVVILPNGNIVAGGGGSGSLAQWDGNTWSLLGSGADGVINALAVLPNGNLVAGGTFQTIDGVAASRIAAWNGSTWSAIGDGLSGSVSALAVLPNGDLIAGGSFTEAIGTTPALNRIGRWNGSSWSALGDGLSGSVYVLSALPTGVLLAGGAFNDAIGSTPACNNVARWHDGVWTALTSGSAGAVYGLAPLAGNQVAVGGYPTQADSNAGIAVWTDCVSICCGTGGSCTLVSSAAGCVSGTFNAAAEACSPPPIWFSLVNTGSAAQVNDASGNGNNNGIAEPGESNLLVTIPIINRRVGAGCDYVAGTPTVSGVSATLTSLTPTASVITGVAAYPALAPRAQGSNQSPFAIAVSASHPCGTPINLRLTLTATGSAEQSVLEFSVPVGIARTESEAAWTGALAIPNNVPTGVSVEVVVAGVSSPLTNVKFHLGGTESEPFASSTTVGLSHGNVGDLVITLTSPSGTVVTLMNRPGFPGPSTLNNFYQLTLDDSATALIQEITNSMAQPMTGALQPASPLSVFNGENANGTWTLHVSDEAANNAGTLRAFSLLLTSSDVCLAPGGGSGDLCCRGTTCNAVSAGTCTGAVAGSASVVVGSCGAGNALASCCHADFNHDGSPTIDDLFLYLNAYFTGSPWANVGGDGVAAPTIDDLFLYINAYFTGCQ